MSIPTSNGVTDRAITRWLKVNGKGLMVNGYKMNIELTLDEALARASEGLRQKMEYSIRLLQKAERLALAYDRRGGYYLAFSGGKDSQALLHIAQLAGVRYTGHMNLTSVDPPEVIRFLKQHYPEVELIKPKASIYQIAVEKTLLPTQRVRWCCEEYKENAGAGKVTLIGIRHQESTRRAKRNEVEISSRKFSGTLEGFEQYREEKLSKPKKGRPAKGVNITNATGERTIGCISGKESLLISPIIHWTERDVWEFLNKVCRVPHCSLYDEGYRRIGCICCPMSSYRQKVKEMNRWPHVKRNWIKAIIAIRRGGVSQGKLTDSNPVVRYWRRLEAHHRRNWGGTFSIQTRNGGSAGFQVAPRLTA